MRPICSLVRKKSKSLSHQGGVTPPCGVAGIRSLLDVKKRFLVRCRDPNMTVHGVAMAFACRHVVSFVQPRTTISATKGISPDFSQSQLYSTVISEGWSSYKYKADVCPCHYVKRLPISKKVDSIGDRAAPRFGHRNPSFLFLFLKTDYRSDGSNVAWKTTKVKVHGYVFHEAETLL